MSDPDTQPMKVIYEQFIPNEMFPTFWEMCKVGAWWSTGPTYARWRDEVRGYAGGTGDAIDVPRWPRFVLWFKIKVLRRTGAVVYGR